MICLQRLDQSEDRGIALGDLAGAPLDPPCYQVVMPLTLVPQVPG